LGSLKSNVGHLDAAAGVAGVIKTALALKYRTLPPTVHYRRPNPQIDFSRTPFFVNDRLRAWPETEGPRRAGVSAFGVGGTNAHVVLEQPPASAPRRMADEGPNLFVLSARSATALATARRNLAAHLREHPEVSLLDAAYSLKVGRRAFDHRLAFVARGRDEAVAKLEGREGSGVHLGARLKHAARVVFMFPGQGSQYPDMGRDLYEREPEFRRHLDHCAAILGPLMPEPLIELLYPAENSAQAKQRLMATVAAQPAIFCVEYALAKLWISWGLHPAAMIGHSIGEFVAAVLAGVFSLEDALTLVAMRGRLMQALPGGAMLAVRLPEADVRGMLPPTLGIAAINGPALCVVSGPHDAVAAFETLLAGRGAVSRRLHTSHAFHSPMVDPVIEPLRRQLETMRLSPPSIPYVSCVTGDWLRPEQATSTQYWASHAREPVRFADGIAAVCATDGVVLAEVGPGNALTTLALQSVRGRGIPVVSCMQDAERARDDVDCLLEAVGRMWTAGAQPDWRAEGLAQGLAPSPAGQVAGGGRDGSAGALPARVSLPTYPFERSRHWIDAPKIAAAAAPSALDAALASGVGAASAAAETMFDTLPVLAAEPVSDRSVPAAEPVFATDFILAAEAIPAEPRSEVPMLQDIRMNQALGDRTQEIRATIAAIFEDLSGERPESTDAETTFLEMGYDSLFLTQVAQKIQSQMGVKITFRQLLGDHSTIPSLAAFLVEKMPKKLPPPPVLARPSAPSAPSAPSSPSAPSAPPAAAIAAAPAMPPARAESAGYSGVEGLFRDQLQAMSQLINRQFDVLQGLKVAQPAAAYVAPAASAAPAPRAAVMNVTVTTAAPSPAVNPTPAAADLLAAAPVEAPRSALFQMYKPKKSGDGGISAAHKKHIDELIARTTAKTPGSKRDTATYRAVSADPRVAAGFRAEWKEMVYPIVVKTAAGSKLYDVDDNEYIDLVNGYGQTALGHAPDFVVNAVKAQLDKGFAIGPQAELTGKVAALFCELTGNERMAFCNTGSEAVMAAMRVARTVTGREKIVVFNGDYHGQFDEVLVKGVQKPGANPRSMPVAPGIPSSTVQNMVVLEYGSPQTLQWIREHAEELAAVVVEPVQSRHPNLRPFDFLREVRAITAASGTAFVMDEVVTGFRVHPGGMQAITGIGADLATYGKVVGGGLPVGVIAGKAKFMDALDGGNWNYGDDSIPETGVTFFAGTFVRHPLLLAAAWSVLNHLKYHGSALQETLTGKTERLVERLNHLFGTRGIATKVETYASWFYFNFHNEHPLATLFYYHLRERGIHIQDGFPCFLTTAHSDADFDRIYAAFESTVEELQSVGILGGSTARIEAAPGVQIEAAAGLPVAAAPTLGVAGAGGTMPAAGDAATVATAPVAAIGAATVAEGATAAADPVGGPLALTESQMEIWLAAQMGDEASCAFNESVSMRMSGRLDAAALHSAMTEVVARHDALRATFSPTGEEMHIAAPGPFDFPTTDLSAQPAAEAESAFAQLIADDARTAFDLVQGPVIRARLIKFSDDSHVFTFTAHHIVCDGWSINVVVSELAEIYGAASRGEPSSLPAPMAFSEYARAQAHRSTADLEVTEKFWLAEFKDRVPPLELPTDRPRPAIKSFSGASLIRRIDAKLYQAVKKAGARQRSTLFVTLLAAFQTLMGRLANQSEVVVGVPTAGQSMIEDRILVGHCVNFLPLRGAWDRETSVSQFLSRTAKRVLDAYEHQDYTFGTLVRKLKLPREPGRLPLAEIQFNLERLADRIALPGLTVDVTPNAKARVNFDLFLNVIESAEGLRLDCDYNTDLFDAATIDHWLDCYQALLEAFVADATQPLCHASCLPPAERRRLLIGVNDTAADYPRDACVHQLIEAQAASTPAAIAARFGDETLSYEALNARANQLANVLAERLVGAKTGRLIGVSVDRSLDMLVALLAVLKAGCAYVPLDPLHPAARLRHILGEAEVAALISDGADTAALVAADVPVIDVRREVALIAAARSTQPAAVARADDLAYVIYTSGSTGRPKGVEIPHRAVVNLLTSMARQPGLGAEDVLFAVTTISFDIAALELFLPLIVGGQVVIAARNAVVDGYQALMQMEATGATAMQATPAGWRLLLEAGFRAKPGFKMLCGGEALPRELANRLLEGSGELWNMYGPTETTIWSSCTRLSASSDLITVGSPIANTQFYVLDAYDEPVPAGVPGQLHIGGEGVARGYYKRADLTEEKFVRNPFAPGRMYRSGDSARWLPSGGLQVLGRIDHQIKLRGYRIELGEIESALMQQKQITAAAVILREDVPGAPRLVAYYVESGSALAPDALHNALSEQLPDYMIPSAWVRLDALPVSPNGKLDRGALPVPDFAPAASEEFVAPTTPTEIALAKIFAEVLHLGQVSANADLLKLGADSIQLFQITARANRSGIKLSAKQLLQHRNAAALAALVDAGEGDTSATAGDPKLPSLRQFQRNRQVGTTARR
jgi:amino acid adenylation domain-containing protein